MTIGMPASSRAILGTEWPSTPGSIRSRTINAGSIARLKSRSSRPSVAMATSTPARSRYKRTRPAILGSSSTTRTRSRVLVGALKLPMHVKCRGPDSIPAPDQKLPSASRDRAAKVLLRVACDRHVAARFGLCDCRPRGEQASRMSAVEGHREDSPVSSVEARFAWTDSSDAQLSTYRVGDLVEGIEAAARRNVRRRHDCSDDLTVEEEAAKSWLRSQCCLGACCSHKPGHDHGLAGHPPSL